MFIRTYIERPEFSKYLKEHSQQIVGQVTSAITDISQYKILKVQCIDKLWAEYREKEYIICIKDNVINSLKFSKIQNFNYEICRNLVENNKIIIGDELHIIHSERFAYDLRQHALDVSQNNYCVFYLNAQGTHIFYKGAVIQGSNVFFSEKDLFEYSERKSIIEINEVLKQYKDQYLSASCNLFFEYSETLRRELNCINILRNRPERIMKANLTRFLNKSLKHSFTVDVPLTSSSSTIDIYTEVNGEVYFFTIEWLGVSVSECGTTFGENHTDEHAKMAINKTLEYIGRLKEINGENFKRGYYIIFDARDEKGIIDYQNFNFLSDELRGNIEYMEKVTEFDIRSNVA